MPTINLPKKAPSLYKRVYFSSCKKDNLNHKVVYNTTMWRALRVEKLKMNPLCERCFKKGIICSGVEVHHKITLSSGKSISEKQKLGFDIFNLETLCKQCHKDEHFLKPLIPTQ